MSKAKYTCRYVIYMIAYDNLPCDNCCITRIPVYISQEKKPQEPPMPAGGPVYVAYVE